MTTSLELALTGSWGEVTLHGEEHGTGPTVLLLHGGAGPASVTGFAALLAERAGVRVIAPTHPGFGGTPRPSTLTTIGGLAEVYDSLLDALDLDGVTVIGNSVGGWIAAELALRHPSRLTRLMLVDAVGIEVEEHPVRDIAGLTLAEVTTYSWFDPTKASIPEPATLPQAARDILAGNRSVLALYGGRMMDPELLARLGGIRVPTLVLWGEADRIVDAEYGRVYAAAIPGARFQLLPHTGHVPQVETPDLLVDAVRPFVVPPQGLEP